MEQSLHVGDPFPSFLVEEIGSGQLIFIDEQIKHTYNLYAIFMADCPPCSLGGSLQSLEPLRTVTEARGQRVMVIFSSRFSADQLLEYWLKYNSSLPPLYMAKQEIQGLEDIYYLRSFSSEALAVVTDSRGVIREIHPLSEYVDQLLTQEEKK